MIIKNLQLQSFRNFEQLEINFSDTVNIFYGNNGSGKTNLLESIFVLCLGRSHRAATDKVLVKKNSDFYRINGVMFHDEKDIELAVAYQKNSRKKITMDQVPIKMSELYDSFCTVAVAPEDSEILSGSPSVRRNFLDVYLSQYTRKYLHLLTEYQKILAQKNAGLKNKIDISAFNELLVSVGSEIIFMRKQFLDAIKEETKKNYGNISGEFDFDVNYAPSFRIENENADRSEIEKLYREALLLNKAKEEIMERSMIGPHLDDIHFFIDDLPSRSYSSQGEIRTAALSLKLSVYNLIKEKREISPLLLLDEIFAELDLHRAEGLIKLFANFNQLFLTTAIEPPAFLKEKGQSFNISSGEVL